MKLPTKLLLGYAGFVLALGVLGAWSARRLSEITGLAPHAALRRNGLKVIF